jgi:glutathione S-transferase
VPKEQPVSQATLFINSRNYGSWSLRGWLLCKFAGLNFTVEMADRRDSGGRAGLNFTEEVIDRRDPGARAGLLRLSPSALVPQLYHNGLIVWDTLAMGEYLHEFFPESLLLPEDPAARAQCRSVSGEVHSRFVNLRSALPMNIKSHYPGFPMWAGAQADIDRIETIWNECLAVYGGPFLFGATRTVADAMYAPVCTRLHTYDVKVGAVASKYIETILAMPEMADWTAAARLEPDDVEELEMEF